jgi:cathepsin L
MRETKQFYTGDEYQARFGIWMTNARLVREHETSSFTLTLNHLAALTPTEYRSLLGFRPIIAPDWSPVKAVMSEVAYDPTWDWRTKGVVNPIKDQRQCRSSWAFSAIQAAESAHAIKTGKLLSFSESNLVDCANDCYGCDGGRMDDSYSWVIKHQGGKFQLESDYPYKPATRECAWDASRGVGSISKIIYIAHGNEEDLATKCQQYGPVAVAIDASHLSFQLYQGGIWNEPACSATHLKHGVGCLGWGVQSSLKYWIIRNSWGTAWGEIGYMRMIWKKNQCGIASMAGLPLP